MNRIAPGLIRKTSIEIDHIAQRRIQQAINQGGKETEFVAPKIIKWAIEEFYKTPFWLFGQSGRKKYAQVKQKISKILNTKW